MAKKQKPKKNKMPPQKPKRRKSLPKEAKDMMLELGTVVYINREKGNACYHLMGGDFKFIDVILLPQQSNFMLCHTKFSRNIRTIQQNRFYTYELRRRRANKKTIIASIWKDIIRNFMVSFFYERCPALLKLTHIYIVFVIKQKLKKARF